MSTRGAPRNGTCPSCATASSSCSPRPCSEPGAVFLDGTLGMGGHAEAVLGRLPRRAAVGIDRDTEALALAGERLAAYGDRFTGVHAVYDELPRRARRPRARPRVDAVLFDLGVSSLQLDEAERGFAYRHDAPLDMRMDQSAGITAAEVLNTYDAADLERILRELRRGAVRPPDRRRHRPRARAASRSPPRPGSSSCCKKAIPAASPEERRPPGQAHLPGAADRGQRRAGGAGSARCRAAVDALAVGGRIAVLAYHSLEDRLTKQRVRRGAPRGTHPAGPAGRAARARAVPAAAHPRGRGAQRRREGRQPPRRVGPAARRRTHRAATKGQHP